MYIIKSMKFNKEIYTIQPGELYVSDKDEVIGTLLGSCVAVCLHDPVKKISGMNHFMLPGKISESEKGEERTTKYGITAINKLIHHITKIGAEKDSLQAKIFGGGHVTKGDSNALTIPADNIRLAKILIEMEDIPIMEIDVGDHYTRKIFMEVKSGKVFLKKTSRKDVLKKIALQEEEYAMKCCERI